MSNEREIKQRVFPATILNELMHDYMLAQGEDLDVVDVGMQRVSETETVLRVYYCEHEKESS